MEAARLLAERALVSGLESDKQVGWMFQVLTSRQPDQTENAALMQLLHQERDYYSSNPAEATKLIQLGDSKANKSIEPADLAAMTIVSQTILNLDATVWKR